MLNDPINLQMFGEMRLAILNRLTIANGAFTHYFNSKYNRVLDIVCLWTGNHF